MKINVKPENDKTVLYLGGDRIMTYDHPIKDLPQTTITMIELMLYRAFDFGKMIRSKEIKDLLDNKDYD